MQTLNCRLSVASRCKSFLWATFILSFSQPLSVIAVQDSHDPNVVVRQAIASGEFSRAETALAAMAVGQADSWRGELARAQWNAGASAAALDSLRSISSPEVRDEVLQSWLVRRESLAGRAGGITEADFQELMRLIRNTIDPDSWAENGGDGAMEPFPNGVFVDQEGALRRARRDTSGRLETLRRRASQSRGPILNQTTASQARCVSLVRLERECQIYAARGEPVPESLANLAGLYRVDYLVVDREVRDVILVGPAGPWRRDADGRAVNEATGIPVLQLDDLIACLRNARLDGGKFGCSIEPRADNLRATKEYVETTRARGNQLREDLARTLGMQDVVIFGLPETCQAARVLVEADYLMKLIAVGEMASIVEVPNYLDRLRAVAGKSQPIEIARWWFVADLNRLVTNSDHSVFEFQGTGVKLCSETQFLTQNGRRVPAGQPDEATDGFARDFTANFDKLARLYPAFAHLRGVFDLALVSSLLEQHGLAKEVGWHATYFVGGGSAGSYGHVYRLREGAAPKQVASVVTQRTFAIGRGQRETVTAVSGGVTVDFGKIVREAEVQTSLNSKKEQALLLSVGQAPPRFTEDWWWD